MRRIWFWAVAGVLALSLAAGPVRAGWASAARAGSGHALAMVGAQYQLRNVNHDKNAQITSVSCWSAGNCSAGGWYRGGGGDGPFVVSQVHGKWGTAIKVPGRLFGAGGVEGVTSVSCPSARYCGAGGDYSPRCGAFPCENTLAFVVSRVHGRWGAARTVRGTAAPDGGQGALVTSVSCPTLGNCGAGGWTADGGCGDFCTQVAWVASEVHGAWKTAAHVETSLDPADGAVVASVSCPSAGNCGAGGYYGPPVASLPYVVSQVRGVWQPPVTVSGGAALLAQVSSVSCPSAGNCGAVGFDGGGGLVVSQVQGTWGKAVGTGARTVPVSVSCASAGNCSAGGYSTDRSGHRQAWVIGEKSGSWGSGQDVPGSGRLNTGGTAQIMSVSCASAGNCSAGGFYTAAGRTHAFVVSERNGVWGKASEVPGIAELNRRNSQVSSISCASPGNCSAGGFYTYDFFAKTIPNYRAFVVSERNGRWGNAKTIVQP